MRNITIEKWTLGLAAAGLVTLSPALLAQTTNEPATVATNAAPQPIPMLTALAATTISGYVDTSAVWNPGTGNANPAPYALNAGKQDGFNLDSVDIKISKLQDETGWGAGYTAELSYGPDAQFIDAGAYPIRQAYVSLHMPVGNGIDWQLGRFDNILGYESNDGYKNPNFTHSYGYTAEPTEHTGLMGTYKFCDAIALEAGVVDTVTTEALGVNTRVGSESQKGAISLLTLTAPDSWGFLKGSTLAGGFDYGQGNPQSTPGAVVPGQGGGEKNRYEYYLGLTLNTPVKGLTVGAAWDAIVHEDVFVGAADLNSGYFTSYAGYATYSLTDKLSIDGRIEYAQGQALGDFADAANGVAVGPGGVLVYNPMNKVVAVTGTLQYTLWANVISRLEVRWDHDASGRQAADGSAAGFGGNGTLGSAAPDKLNEVMVAANVIYKF